jgi:hypothetical protein
MRGGYWKRAPGRKASLSNDIDLFYKAHLAVLQQSSLVAPYIQEHKQIISSQNPTKTEDWLYAITWKHFIHG